MAVIRDVNPGELLGPLYREVDILVYVEYPMSLADQVESHNYISGGLIELRLYPGSTRTVSTPTAVNAYLYDEPESDSADLVDGSGNALAIYQWPDSESFWWFYPAAEAIEPTDFVPATPPVIWPFSLQLFAHGIEVELPEPNTAELYMPSEIPPVLTQSGFFVPVQAIDDIEAVWQFSWDHLPKRLIDQLEPLQSFTLLTLNDPLGLVTYGYIENIDYEGVPGTVDQERNEAVYGMSMEFRVVFMELPAALTEFTEGQIIDNQGFGISPTGTPPMVFRTDQTPDEQNFNTTEMLQGWVELTGGDRGPWAGHQRTEGVLYTLHYQTHPLTHYDQPLTYSPA